MAGKEFSKLIVIVTVFLVVASVSNGSQKLDLALEEGLKSQSSGVTNEASCKFEKALIQAKTPRKRVTILFLMADFFMKKNDLSRAGEVYTQMVGLSSKMPHQEYVYGIAKGELIAGNQEKAKILCRHIAENDPGNTLLAFAKILQKTYPQSSDARLCSFIEGFKAAPKKIEPYEIPVRSKIHPEVPSGISSGRCFVASDSGKTEVPNEKGNSRHLDETNGLASTRNSTNKNSEDTLPMAPGTRFVAEGGVWASFRAGTINARGMKLDTDTGTDLDWGSQPWLNLGYHLSRKNRISLSYFSFDHSGKIVQAVTYNNVLFGSGSPLTLRSRFFELEGYRGFDTIRNQRWGFLFGWLFSREEMDLIKSIPGGQQTGSLNRDFSGPYLGFEGRARLSASFSLQGRAKLSYFGRGDPSFENADFEFKCLFGHDYGKKPVSSEWYGFLGYRHFEFLGTTGNNSSEIIYSGPIFGLEAAM